ncbi:MAG: bifunctional anthranilate synthase component II/anthranilate phosphoribosyltransferase [Oscillospiraceae bacterium]|nr:bifunctional anthranilate synthase component II/anthranilate phosphoribosyltransferase [Oscillospiraceae bacterium]
MILLIDNYDSFTYNLYQYIGTVYKDIEVVRNDEITLEEIDKKSPEAIIISPGPGYPKDAGITVDVVKKFSGKVPILGICLGSQAIGEAFGGEVVLAKELMHGKASEISLDKESVLFKNLPAKIKAARYHSLIVDNATMPECLKRIAWDKLNQIMALEHREYKTFGLQFHPESILTDFGKVIIVNFLKDVCNLTLDLRSISMPVIETPKIALKPLIAKVVDGNNLTEEESYKAVDEIMSGNATNAQIGSFLTALRLKGETIDEITGFAKAMRDKGTHIDGCEDAIDIVGTGGDLASSFNISTTSAFVVASAGLKVAKHGNRSVSSKSGAADVLESLGVKITTTPEKAKELLSTTGMSFLFAQSYHGSMRFVGPARGEVGIRTVFNILGPLANPAHSDYIVLGTYSKDLLEPMAKVLLNVGIKKALLVYGDDMLDEISISSTTSVCEVSKGKIKKYSLSPVEFGFEIVDKSEIVGGNPDFNANITLGILKGEITGAKRNIVLLNAGAALYTGGKAQSVAEGVKLATECIDSGKAYAKLKEYIIESNK